MAVGSTSVGPHTAPWNMTAVQRHILTFFHFEEDYELPNVGWHKQTQARFRCFLLHTCDVLHVARWLCNIVVCGRLDWFECCRYEYNESDLYRFLLYCFIASDLRFQHRRCKSGNFSMRLETLILCFWGRSKRRQSYTERLQVPKGTIFNWQTWFSCVVFMTIVFTHQNHQTLCFNVVFCEVFRCLICLQEILQSLHGLLRAMTVEQRERSFRQLFSQQQRLRLEALLQVFRAPFWIGTKYIIASSS